MRPATAAKNAIVAATVGLDLLALGLFKYYGFFVARRRTSSSTPSGSGMPLPLLSLALPVGLSFFTFQAISLHRRRHAAGICEPRADARLRALPVVLPAPGRRADRPRARVPPAARDARATRATSRSAPACVLIVVGLVKKVAIADFLAREVVDPVFARPRGLRVLRTWPLAAYAYAAQIYCDFSGYTDIAIGAGAADGVRLPAELRPPYRPLGFRDFWRRWHMTLSRFLRDFLYIPLGGIGGGKRAPPAT